MADSVTAPRVEDLVSVGTRIRWSAIFAGGILALALYFLLSLLGGAVGLTVSERINPTNLHTAALVWTILITCVALFVGGLVTSQFTVGENKVEAALYGIIMWALLLAFLLGLGAAGVRAGFSAMVGAANLSHVDSTQNWETNWRNAGVPADQIEAWRRRLSGAADKAAQEVQDPQNREAIREAATRVTWYAFAGLWVSMMAAAAGAVFGAGPTFRIVAVGETSRVMTR